MLRKIMIVLITGVALAGAPTAEASPHGGGGGGGHVGGGFGGAHFGGGFGGTHFGGGLSKPHLGGQAFGRAVVGPNFATAGGHFDHNRGFGRHFDHHRRFARGYGFWPGWDYYDDGCSYNYPYYNYTGCYVPSY